MLFSNLVQSQTTVEMIQLFNKGKYSKVIKQASSAWQKDTTNIETSLLLGRTYTELKKFNIAIPYLNKVLHANSMGWAWAEIYLGKCYIGLNQKEDAIKYFESAIRRNETKNSRQSATVLLAKIKGENNFKKWETIKCRHFKFHFQNKSVIADFKTFIENHDKAFDSINKFFKCRLVRKINYYIWNDRDLAEIVLGKSIGFAVSSTLTIHSGNNQSVGHEMTHVLNFRAFFPSYSSRFINEGIAVYFDLDPRDKIAKAIKRNHGEHFSIYSMWDDKKMEEGRLYAIGGAFIQFLMQKGTPKQMKQLLSNQTLDNAMKIYPHFGTLTTEFESLFFTKPLPLNSNL